MRHLHDLGGIITVTINFPVWVRPELPALVLRRGASGPRHGHAQFRPLARRPLRGRLRPGLRLVGPRHAASRHLQVQRRPRRQSVTARMRCTSASASAASATSSPTASSRRRSTARASTACATPPRGTSVTSPVHPPGGLSATSAASCLVSHQPSGAPRPAALSTARANLLDSQPAGSQLGQLHQPPSLASLTRPPVSHLRGAHQLGQLRQPPPARPAPTRPAPHRSTALSQHSLQCLSPHHSPISLTRSSSPASSSRLGLQHLARAAQQPVPAQLSVKARRPTSGTQLTHTPLATVVLSTAHTVHRWQQPSRGSHSTATGTACVRLTRPRWH